MMARGHLLSGAVVGVCLSGTLALADAPLAVRLGVIPLCTLAVLVPDIDSRRATITTWLGPLGWGLHHLTIAVGRWLFYRTRLPDDEESAGTGHRLISHTFLAALLSGILVAAGTGMAGTVLVALAAGWSDPWGQGAHAVGNWWGTGAGSYWWAWGMAVGIGHAVGCIGDTLTVAGAPVWFPIPVEGRRWYPARSGMPFRANGLAEHALVVPALYGALGVSVVWVLGWWPPLWQLASGLVRGA